LTWRQHTADQTSVKMQDSYSDTHSSEVGDAPRDPRSTCDIKYSKASTLLFA